MAEGTNLFEMESLLLVMEFKRLTELETRGETDTSVSYDVDDLEEQILFRLNEYEANR